MAMRGNDSIFGNFRIFIEFLRVLYKDRHMVSAMALRELKKNYIGSAFGITWAILNPLSQVAIYGIVFGVFFKIKPDAVYGTDSFFLYLICGLVPWQFFSQAVSSSTRVLVDHGNLIKTSAGFPSEVLPIVTISSHIISHLIAMLLVLVILLVFGVTLTPYALLVFLYLFFMVVFTVGASWVFASINVYFRDMEQLIGVIMTGWFFFTPIFYSVGIVPEKLVPLLKLNPMFHVVEGYRYSLLAGKFPPTDSLILLVIYAVIVFGLGGVLFRKLKPGFAEVL